MYPGIRVSYGEFFLVSGMGLNRVMHCNMRAPRSLALPGSSAFEVARVS